MCSTATSATHRTIEWLILLFIVECNYLWFLSWFCGFFFVMVSVVYIHHRISMANFFFYSCDFGRVVLRIFSINFVDGSKEVFSFFFVRSFILSVVDFIHSFVLVSLSDVFTFFSMLLHSFLQFVHCLHDQRTMVCISFRPSLLVPILILFIA